MADKSAQNIIDAIEKSKTKPLSKFLYALGIRNVGETTAEDLARNFSRLDDFFHLSEEDLMEVEGIGPEVAASVHQFFRDKKNRESIDRLKKAGVKVIEPKAKEKGNWQARRLFSQEPSKPLGEMKPEPLWNQWAQQPPPPFQRKWTLSWWAKTLAPNSTRPRN